MLLPPLPSNSPLDPLKTTVSSCSPPFSSFPQSPHETTSPSITLASLTGDALHSIAAYLSPADLRNLGCADRGTRDVTLPVWKRTRMHGFQCARNVAYAWVRLDLCNLESNHWKSMKLNRMSTEVLVPDILSLIAYFVLV